MRRAEVQRGQVVCLPGSVRPHTRFRADVYLLSAKEGGRRTGFAGNYRPQFYFRTCDVVGSVSMDEVPIALPGDTVALTVELGKPIAMDRGLGFAIRERGRMVGAGTVGELLE